MKSNNRESQNLRMAITFFALVIFLLFLSFIFKFIFTVKESGFDNSNNFTLAVFKKEEAQVLNFEPSTKSVSILNLKFKKGSKVITDKSIGKFLEIPIDVKVEKDSFKIETNNLSMAVLKLFPQINILDSIKLSFFSNSVQESSISENSFDIENEKVVDSSLQKIIQGEFQDPAIISEKQSIEVVNGAGVYGLGTRLSLFLTNIGGNVILLSNSDNPENLSSILYSGKKSYTVERIAKALGIKTVKNDKRSISDITIIIGRDMAFTFSF